VRKLGRIFKKNHVTPGNIMVPSLSAIFGDNRHKIVKCITYYVIGEL